jgi:hypothetical protein
VILVLQHFVRACQALLLARCGARLACSAAVPAINIDVCALLLGLVDIYHFFYRRGLDGDVVPKNGALAAGPFI